jgi:hypothetical protein
MFRRVFEFSLQDIAASRGMIRVVIVSPLRANSREEIEENKAYAKRCVLDCLKRGESPYASHLFFDQNGILDEMKPEDRNLGMNAGLTWGMMAQKVVAYVDLGYSHGMEMDLAFYKGLKLPIEFRKLYGTI